MVKRRNKINLAISITTPIFVTLVLFFAKIIDTVKIISQGNELQYNIISYSAIIAGFLFTGLSILVSVIDKDRIKRLWDHHYLDNLYKSAMVGIVANIVSIFIALIVIFCMTCSTLTHVLIWGEICAILISIVQFSWCVGQLYFIIKRLKNND